MGTTETRKQKIAWMKTNKKLFEKKKLLNEFMLLFSSTNRTAKEIYNLVK